MEFIKLNWLRLFTKYVINLWVSECAMVLFIEYSRHWDENISNILREFSLPIIVAVTSFTTLMFFINLQAYYYFGKKFKTRSDQSITTLFDNEYYTIGVYESPNYYFYAQYCLNGFIAGYPVKISYRQSGKQFDVIVFVYMVDPNNNTEIIKRPYTSISDGWLKLFNKAKPNILDCINKYKDKGYLPSKQIPI